MFCQNTDDDGEWNRILSEVDKDGNAEIDFTEFSIMMNKMLDINPRNLVDDHSQSLSANISFDS